MSRTAEAAIRPPATRLFRPNPDSPLNTPGASRVPPLNELEHETSLYYAHEATVNERIVRDALQAQRDARQQIEVNNKKRKAPANREDNEDERQSGEPPRIENDDERHTSLDVTQQELDVFKKEAHKEKRGTKAEREAWPGLRVLVSQLFLLVGPETDNISRNVRDAQARLVSSSTITWRVKLARSCKADVHARQPSADGE
jgi:hypothetical protein